MSEPAIKNIRLASLADVPALTDLIAASVRRLSASYYSSEQIDDALAHIFGVDTQLILDRTYFVAEERGQIVGAGGWSKRATLYGGDQMKTERPDPLLNPAVEPARIRAFYVHPDWSRKGIARRLLDACETAVKDAGFQRIELIATLPGEPLYASCGYTRFESVDLRMPGGKSLPAFRMGKVMSNE